MATLAWLVGVLALSACDALATAPGRGLRGHHGPVHARAARACRALPRALGPLNGDAVSAAAQSTSALLAAEGSDVFRLALTGGLGIMAFSILNAFLVGAVARGNWQVFEDEASAWIKDDPTMKGMSANILSNDDLDLPAKRPSVDDSE